MEFLQSLIDNKIYTKLFEFFNFDKAILYNNDRYINENIFIQKLRQLNFSRENMDEIIYFILPLFKSNNKMISFSLVKKKISSNLKNFFDDVINRKTFDNNNSSMNSSEVKESNIINANEAEQNDVSEGKENNNE